LDKPLRVRMRVGKLVDLLLAGGWSAIPQPDAAWLEREGTQVTIKGPMPLAVLDRTTTDERAEALQTYGTVRRHVAALMCVMRTDRKRLGATSVLGIPHVGGFDLVAQVLSSLLANGDAEHGWWTSMAEKYVAVDVKCWRHVTLASFVGWLQRAADTLRAAQRPGWRHEALGFVTSVVFVVHSEGSTWHVALPCDGLLAWRSSFHVKPEEGGPLPTLHLFGGEVPEFELAWLSALDRASHPIWRELARSGAAGPAPGEPGSDGERWVTVADAAALLLGHMPPAKKSRRGVALAPSLRDEHGAAAVKKLKAAKEGRGVWKVQDACRLRDLPPFCPEFYHNGHF